MLLEKEVCAHRLCVVEGQGMPRVHPTKGLFSQLLPAPAGLAELDAFDLGAYHLSFGDARRAKELLESVNEAWPFATDTPSVSEIASYVRNSPELSAAGVKAAKVLRATGALSPAAWKEQHWGAEKDVSDFSYTEEQGLVLISFQCAQSYLRGVCNFVANHRVLSALIAEPKTLNLYRVNTSVAGQSSPFSLEVLKFENLDELEDAWRAYLTDNC